MTTGVRISGEAWGNFLLSNSDSYKIYAPVKRENIIDYELINVSNLDGITYNLPKPITPLKVFFLPVKENVFKEQKEQKRNLIIGVPACDLAALDILDEFYLREPFIDPFYKKRRDNTVLIGTPCFETLEHCHCTTYGVNPFPEKSFDVLLFKIEDSINLTWGSDKGEEFINQLKEQIGACEEVSDEIIDTIETKRKEVIAALNKSNAELPDYKETGELIKNSDDDIWEKYSSKCVSCGGCSTICPTCTCFLLVDRPGFEKVRQMDACQYPGFARVAAGEDPMKELARRFKNRYMCKYVWKPQKFEGLTCTGCGRCIETCIGRIDKNELFKELAETTVSSA